MAHLQRYPSQLPMRPINKETEAVELDQLFESYVETDLFQQLTTSTADPSGSDDLAHLFDLSSSNQNDLFGFTPILHREPEPWHKATQLGSQNPTSSSDSAGSSVAYNHFRGKSTSSDSDTLSFEDLFELERNQLRSTSQPSTPRPTTAPSASTTSKCIKKAQSVPSIARGVQKSLKKCPSSSFAKTAKMMQPSYYRAPVPHMWTRKMDSAVDLHAHVLPISMHSPPSSTKISQDECADGFFVQQHHQMPYTTTRSPMVEGGSSPDMGFSNYQLTPQASPAIGVSNGSDPFAQNMGLTYSSAASSAALSAFTPPSSLRIPMTTWAPSESPAMEFPFSTCSPDFSTTKTAGWWNDDSMPMAHTQPYPSARESHARTTSQSMPASTAGLGISCDTTSFVDTESYSHQPQDMQAYHPGMYPTPPTHPSHPSNMVPIGTRPASRSPSPTPQPSFHRRRPSGQAQRSSTAAASRRKSSQSSHGSRAPSQGNVGFVNFTPDDSRKILTGVAPSGSSKTKARREKEAAEKRRKLSLAAVKAVMEAGGDVERLRMLEMEGGF
ncbi:hypothetical protein E8E12_001572 [Didymella heteroderae]|uniref:Developmental regulatory protein wetA n=1 Tax=Didymella heteroderae TaxID=1769908 RepID=A0A9P4WSU9_9PLEO|nr:hypothetical protein E8E12_001572 [Didymella heteroderae]